MSTIRDRVYALLSDGKGRTHEQIVWELGCSASRSRGSIAELKNARRVHVCDWRINLHNRPSPIFSIGEGPDVPAPEIKERCQKEKIYRHKVAKLRREQRPYVEQMSPIVRDPFVAALFGTVAVMDATPLPKYVHQLSMEVSDDELEAA